MYGFDVSKVEFSPKGNGVYVTTKQEKKND